MAKTAAKQIDKTKPRPALSVTSRRESFWRCGRQFQRSAPTQIPLDELTDEQIDRLEGEDELIVTRTQTPPEAPPEPGAGKS